MPHEDPAARAAPPVSPRARWLWLAGLLGVVFAVAAAGGAATDTRGWYEALAKPAFNPPGWVFGPVWTALYAIMAYSAWRVVVRAGWPGARPALAVFGAQLALNLAWSWLFFGAQRPDLALVDIVALDVAVLATIWAFNRHDRVAAWLLTPYFAWISFATALNAAIVVMN